MKIWNKSIKTLKKIIISSAKPLVRSSKTLAVYFSSAFAQKKATTPLSTQNLLTPPGFSKNKQEREEKLGKKILEQAEMFKDKCLCFLLRKTNWLFLLSKPLPLPKAIRVRYTLQKQSAAYSSPIRVACKLFIVYVFGSFCWLAYNTSKYSGNLTFAQQKQDRLSFLRLAQQKMSNSVSLFQESVGEIANLPLLKSAGEPYTAETIENILAKEKENFAFTTSLISAANINGTSVHVKLSPFWHDFYTQNYVGKQNLDSAGFAEGEASSKLAHALQPLQNKNNPAAPYYKKKEQIIFFARKPLLLRDGCFAEGEVNYLLFLRSKQLQSKSIALQEAKTQSSKKITNQEDLFLNKKKIALKDQYTYSGTSLVIGPETDLLPRKLASLRSGFSWANTTQVGKLSKLQREGGSKVSQASLAKGAKNVEINTVKALTKKTPLATQLAAAKQLVWAKDLSMIWPIPLDYLYNTQDLVTPKESDISLPLESKLQLESDILDGFCSTKERENISTTLTRTPNNRLLPSTLEIIEGGTYGDSVITEIELADTVSSSDSLKIEETSFPLPAVFTGLTTSSKYSKQGEGEAPQLDKAQRNEHLIKYKKLNENSKNRLSYTDFFYEPRLQSGFNYPDRPCQIDKKYKAGSFATLTSFAYSEKQEAKAAYFAPFARLLQSNALAKGDKLRQKEFPINRVSYIVPTASTSSLFFTKAMPFKQQPIKLESTQAYQNSINEIESFLAADLAKQVNLLKKKESLAEIKALGSDSLDSAVTPSPGLLYLLDVVSPVSTAGKAKKAKLKQDAFIFQSQSKKRVQQEKDSPFLEFVYRPNQIQGYISYKNPEGLITFPKNSIISRLPIRTPTQFVALDKIADIKLANCGASFAYFTKQEKQKAKDKPKVAEFNLIKDGFSQNKNDLRRVSDAPESFFGGGSLQLGERANSEKFQGNQQIGVLYGIHTGDPYAPVQELSSPYTSTGTSLRTVFGKINKSEGDPGINFTKTLKTKKLITNYRTVSNWAVATPSTGSWLDNVLTNNLAFGVLPSYSKNCAAKGLQNKPEELKKNHSSKKFLASVDSFAFFALQKAKEAKESTEVKEAAAGTPLHPSTSFFRRLFYFNRAAGKTDYSLESPFLYYNSNSKVDGMPEDALFRIEEYKKAMLFPQVHAFHRGMAFNSLPADWEGCKEYTDQDIEIQSILGGMRQRTEPESTAVALQLQPKAEQAETGVLLDTTSEKVEVEGVPNAFGSRAVEFDEAIANQGPVLQNNNQSINNLVNTTQNETQGELAGFGLLSLQSKQSKQSNSYAKQVEQNQNLQELQTNSNKTASQQKKSKDISVLLLPSNRAKNKQNKKFRSTNCYPLRTFFTVSPQKSKPQFSLGPTDIGEYNYIGLANTYSGVSVARQEGGASFAGLHIPADLPNSAPYYLLNEISTKVRQSQHSNSKAKAFAEQGNYEKKHGLIFQSGTSSNIKGNVYKKGLYLERIHGLPHYSWMSLSKFVFFAYGWYGYKILATALNKSTRLLPVGFTEAIGLQTVQEKYRIIRQSKTKQSFRNLAGAEKTLSELRDLIWTLRLGTGEYSRKKLHIPYLGRQAGQRRSSVTSKTRNRFLLVGPPGTGKTLLVKTLAAEANVPVLVQPASQLRMISGVENPVSALFHLARQIKPCIIFLDELDTLGSAVDTVTTGKQSQTSEQAKALRLARKYTYTLLLELDGLTSSTDDLLVIGATNRPETLNPALTRAGRFDTVINCNLPSQEQRLAVLSLYLNKHNVLPLEKAFASLEAQDSQNQTLKAESSKDELRSYLAQKCYGLSQASIATVVNESALESMLYRDRAVHTLDTLERAIESVRILTAKGTNYSPFSCKARATNPDVLLPSQKALVLHSKKQITQQFLVFTAYETVGSLLFLQKYSGFKNNVNNSKTLEVLLRSTREKQVLGSKSNLQSKTTSFFIRKNKSETSSKQSKQQPLKNFNNFSNKTPIDRKNLEVANLKTYAGKAAASIYSSTRPQMFKLSATSGLYTNPVDVGTFLANLNTLTKNLNASVARFTSQDNGLPKFVSETSITKQRVYNFVFGGSPLLNETVGAKQLHHKTGGNNVTSTVIPQNTGPKNSLQAGINNLQILPNSGFAQVGASAMPLQSKQSKQGNFANKKGEQQLSTFFSRTRSKNIIKLSNPLTTRWFRIYLYRPFFRYDSPESIENKEYYPINDYSTISNKARQLPFRNVSTRRVVKQAIKYKEVPTRKKITSSSQMLTSTLAYLPGPAILADLPDSAPYYLLDLLRPVSTKGQQKQGSNSKAKIAQEIQLYHGVEGKGYCHRNLSHMSEESLYLAIVASAFHKASCLVQEHRELLDYCVYKNLRYGALYEFSLNDLCNKFE